MNDKEIGQRIRECREQVGLSQLELAVKLSFESATAVSLIESGQRSLSIENLVKLPSILGQPIGYFIGKVEMVVPERKNLRDEFAMAALTGSLSNDEFLKSYSWNQFADLAYTIAQAMMEERKKYEN